LGLECDIGVVISFYKRLYLMVFLSWGFGFSDAGIVFNVLK
jgi:hypothetical protein